MTPLNPALFYFWAHGSIGKGYNPMDELDTPTFRTLINRSDSVFLEFVSPNLDGSRELERDLNEYIKTGEMPIKLRECYDYQIESQGETGYDFFIANLIQRTQKRIVLEKTLSAPFNFNEENDRASRAFFERSFNQALEAKRIFLEMNEKYQVPREIDVAEQISALPETTLVIFGAGHPQLERIVSAQRPTEVHFPYYNYNNGFATHLGMKYRETGEVNIELFLRSNAEGMVRKGINEKFRRSISSRETDLLAHHYASVLTPDQIVRYKDYTVFCKTMLVGINFTDILESFLKKESITPVEEVLAGLRR